MKYSENTKTCANWIAIIIQLYEYICKREREFFIKKMKLAPAGEEQHEKKAEAAEKIFLKYFDKV